MSPTRSFSSARPTRGTSRESIVETERGRVHEDREGLGGGTHGVLDSGECTETGTGEEWGRTRSFPRRRTISGGQEVQVVLKPVTVPLVERAPTGPSEKDRTHRRVSGFPPFGRSRVCYERGRVSTSTFRASSVACLHDGKDPVKTPWGTVRWGRGRDRVTGLEGEGTGP